MRVFCEDRELNISPRYLRPGFGFGGSCLPKDLRAMLYVAKALDVSAPLVGSVIPSNDAHIQRVVDRVLESRKRRVSMLGLSFKRAVTICARARLSDWRKHSSVKGVPLRIYDPDVAIGDVFGRNRAYVEEHLPHVGQLMATGLDEVVADAELLIVCKRVAGIERMTTLVRDGVTVIDLVGLPQLPSAWRPWASAPDAVAAASVPAPQ